MSRACVEAFVLKAVVGYCCVTSSAQADLPNKLDEPERPSSSGPRIGAFAGGGAFHDGRADGAAFPHPALMGEIGAALRLDLPSSFHGVAQGFLQLRRSSPDTTFENTGSGETISQTTSDRWGVLAARLYAGWWVLQPIALRAGVAVGYVWLDHSESRCGAVKVNRAMYGLTMGAVYAIGPRREVEIGAYIDATDLPKVSCEELIGRNARFSVARTGLVGLLGQVSYFF